ncbi:MAG: tetratricopeptide repeat protein [Vallitalea sp.]|jgi:tetratricopeptide (TPR) repeat protein|nr:tetratricopeptide repeat protein [Vallitalea sp.]
MSKLCLKCGKELDNEYKCKNCGLKMDIYEKIQNTSKLLYNEGLQKAKLRDLSGAISVLNRSLKLDKNNIEARNLLGLIYFEIGEVVSALQQWVISKNIKGNENIAEYYIDKIHRNQHKLDTLNSAIKKYNQAIYQIQQKSEDLAIIQLKKVISLNPRFIKAYCLLALCYIHDNNIAKAKKYLLKVLSIDKNNYIALKYYESITAESQDNEEDLHRVDKVQEPVSVRNTPKKESRVNSSILQFVYIIFGIVIGLLVTLFLIVPGKVKSNTDEIHKLRDQLVAEESTFNEEKNTLEKENKQLKTSIEEKNIMINEFQSKTSHYEAMDELQNAIVFYLDDEEISAANGLSIIRRDDLKSAASKQLYDKLVSELYPKLSRNAYNNGYKLYIKGKNYKNNKYYEEAITELNTAKKFAISTDYLDDILYYTARSYQKLGQKEEAIALFEELVEKYPRSKFKDDAEDFIDYLKRD